MPNLFTRIFRPRKLQESTQLTSIQSLAGFLLSYVSGQMRDMTDTARLDVDEQGYNAYRTNPMGYNFVNVMTNFLFGPGCQFYHPDKTANDLFHGFIRAGKFGRKLIELANGYRIDGVQFPVAYANTLTGEVKVRAIDPCCVKNVVTAEGDYENIIGLYCEYTERVWSEDGRSYNDQQKYEFITQDQNTGPYTVRHFFVWKRPTVAGETRGWSFLTPALHYLVQFREFLKARLNLQRALSTFAWNWKLTGLKGSVASKQAEATAFQSALSQTGAITPGSQVVTAPGDKDTEGGFELEAINAGVTAGTANASGDARSLALQAAVGFSAPEGVATGDWSNANYSSLSLSIQTFIKNIQAEQTIWGVEGFLGEFCDWWLSIQRDARLISEEAANTPMNIIWPVIMPYDLTQLSNILKMLREEKAITRRTLVDTTPFDIDYDAEKDELKAEAEEAEARMKAMGLQPGQPFGQPGQKPNNSTPPIEGE